MNQKQNGASFWRLAPEIWKYQTFTKLLLVPLLAALRTAFPTLREEERLYFSSWREPPLLLAFLVLFALYVSVDLNVKILYAGNVADGAGESFFATLRKAVAAVPKFLNFRGLGVVLYVTLIAPTIAAGFLLFRTQAPPPSAYAVYAGFAAAFAAVGLTRIFYLHGVLLDGLSVGEARRRSKELMRLHWRKFLGHNLAYTLSAFAFITLAGTFLFVLPLSLGGLFLPERFGAATARSVMILILFLNAAFVGALSLLAAPRYVIRVTGLYRQYAPGAPVGTPKRRGKNHPALAAIAFFYVLEIAALSSQTAYRFDEFFPPLTDTRIIAHRGGGNENAENTRSGLETAVALGAYGSEIDIQRTLDGRYVVNHDPTFRRLAGESRAPEEMTLEEVRALPYPVPTLEEMLDASKGRIRLFIELKGATADKQMCDDTVNMILERDMTEQTVLLSFEHDLIAYVEDEWPEMWTCCLTAQSDRNPASFRCDYLGVEEYAVTESMIRAAHAQGKKLLIWTPNNPDAQEYFFKTDADAIITDNVAQATRILYALNRENDLGRILAAFR